MTFTAGEINSALATGVVVFALLDRHYDLEGRARAWRPRVAFSIGPLKADSEIGWLGLSLYPLASRFFVVGGLVSLFVISRTSDPLVMQRIWGAFDVNDKIATGHTLIWDMLVLTMARYGLSDMIRGLYATGLLASMHELGWYVSYFASASRSQLIVAEFYAPFIGLLFALLFAYFLNARRMVPTKKVLLAAAFITAFDILWVSIGFPLTLDNIMGPTALYDSLTVNLIEILSWMGPFFLLL